ncbi:PEP-CTERM sorting domain-containing protein [Gemmatimonas aurantiaca]|uniref:PEP-CTERM sorting domain-containing protein n=1 Tax=Gemmatimonas aurantiaca TaxID=173480 RepID=UPI00301C2876
MRFFKSVMIAAAAVAVMTSGAKAQVNIQVTVNSVYQQAGSGGSFNATFSGVPAGYSLTNIVYCFDQLRTFNYGQTTTYTLLTFDQFLSANATGARWANIDNTDELNTMAGLAGTYNFSNSHNAPIQQQIWDISAGLTNVADGAYSGADHSNSWLVLVDAANWSSGNAGSQSFLVQGTAPAVVTPEPSTYALMAAGLAGLLVANRRRRQTNV